MRDLSAFSRQLADLHQAHNGEHETLEAIVEFATQTLGCNYAGVMLASRDRVVSAAVTDPIVEQADHLQYGLQDGPCLTAIRAGHVEIIQDTAASTRWPTWGRRAADIGVRSSISVQLAYSDSGRTLGSLNAYQGHIRDYDSTDVEVAEILARYASVALARSRRDEAVQDALTKRTSIGQAQGILMERYAITGDQAFAVLRRYSQANNQRLRDVAAHVVSDHGLPIPDDEPA